MGSHSSIVTPQDNMDLSLVSILVISLTTWTADSQISGDRYYWEWVTACSNWAVETQNRYFCTHEGKIECREGWQWNMCQGPMCAYLETPATFCNRPKCSEGCDPVNGRCEIPNTCNCLNGYEGENCTEMISHPYCKNGVARSALEQCVCYEGWQGDLCDVPVCKEGCSLRNGYCLEPNECLCKLGWKGDECKTCARYPGCQHGTCKRPWECTCEPGWDGTYCNETIGAIRAPYDITDTSTDLKDEVVLKKNSWLKKLPSLGKKFNISFDVYINTFKPDYQNVLRLTSTSNDCCKYGDRVPGVWVSKEKKIHICFALNGKGNSCFDGAEVLQAGQWFSVEISQTVDKGKWKYEIKMNKKSVYNVINENAEEFKDVNVFAADNFWPSLDGKIRNLKI